MKKERIISSILAGAMAISMSGCQIKGKENENTNKISIEDQLNNELYNENDVLVFDTKDQEISYDLSLFDLDLLNNLKRFFLLAPKENYGPYLYNYKDILNENSNVNFSPEFSSEGSNDNFSISFDFSYLFEVKNDNKYGGKLRYYNPSYNSFITLKNFLNKYELKEFIKENGNYTKEDIQKIFDYINSPNFTDQEENYYIDDLFIVIDNDNQEFSSLYKKEEFKKYNILKKDNNPTLDYSYLKEIIATMNNNKNFEGYKDVINDSYHNHSYSENYYFLNNDTIIKINNKVQFNKVVYYTYKKNRNNSSYVIIPLKDFLLYNNYNELIKDTYTKEDLINIHSAINKEITLTRK